MRKVLVPGTFDPITNGHMSIIKRAIGLFDKVYIAVAEETYKNTLFDVEERVALVKESVADLENVEAEKFTGLLVDYAQSRGAVAIVRGLRVISDFEYEMQMALMNRRQNSEIETMFLISSSEYSFLSSSIVKEIAHLGGNLDGFVPECIKARIYNKFTN